jgi:hypothetical protein
VQSALISRNQEAINLADLPRETRLLERSEREQARMQARQ